MGNGSCCGHSSNAEEMKLDYIQPQSSRRQYKEEKTNEDIIIQEIYFEESSTHQVLINNDPELTIMESPNIKQENTEKHKGIYDYEVIQKLSFTKYLVKHQDTDTKVLSLVKKSLINNGKNYFEYIQNFKNHKSEILYNPYDIFEDDLNYYIFSDNPSGIRLLDVYLNHKIFTEAEVSKHIQQLCSAIITSEQNLCFINPFEIYIASDETFSIKIIPFSYTPYLFQSPEQIKSIYHEKSVVWNLGVLSYIMLCGNPPFKGDLESSINKGLFDFSGKIWNAVSYAAKSLIMKMLTRNTEKRPSLIDIFNDPWIKGDIKNNSSLKIEKILNEFLKNTKVNECKEELLMFCDEFTEKITELKENTSVTDSASIKKPKEIELVYRDKVEFVANKLEAYKSQQKKLLITILNNLLREIECNSIISSEFANFLLSEINILAESEIIENEISSIDFSDLIISLLTI